MYQWKWGANLLVAFLATSWNKLDKHQEGGGMHVKLRCQMSQWPYKLQGHTKHNAHRHKEDMEYGAMN
jgi:hypothetical protein